MSMEKKGIAKFLFFIEFYVYMIVYTLQTSAFGEFIPSVVYTLTRLLVLGATLCILLLGPKQVKKSIKVLIVVFCLICALENFFVTGFAIPLEFICLIISAKDVDFEWIVRSYIRITLFVLIVSFLSSSVGLIPTNNVVQNGVVRYAFGMNYCTDFAAHIFYLVLADNYLNFKKLSFTRTLTYVITALVIYKFCFAKLDTFLILALVALDLYLMLNALIKNRNTEEFKGTRFAKLLLICLFPLCVFISLASAINFNKSVLLEGINVFLNFRIYYANKALDLYGIPLWGEIIQMVGSGTIAKNPNAGLEYFYVDNSYIFIMLRYGVFILIGLGTLIMDYMSCRIKNRDWILPLMIALTLVSSVIDHHFLSTYNVFLFGYMAFIKEWENRVIPRSRFRIGRNGIYMSR